MQTSQTINSKKTDSDVGEGRKMDELVSVIIPSYKRQKALVERAMRSVLEQSYQNVQLVLIDDNAKPELASYRAELTALVEELDDERVLYIQNEENLGGAGARNEGINHARGEYVTFLDDDDEYLPQKIEQQLVFMKENCLDVCFGKLCIYNEEDKLIDVREHELASFDKTYLTKYHVKKHITGTPTFMLKKSVLEEIGGFEIVPMGQEYYLMQKILQTNAKLGYNPHCYIKAYRTKAEAISTGKNKITGERALFKYKKNFFPILTFSEKQYVRCRHYAVMAIAYKRNKRYFGALWYLLVAVLCSPITAVKEAFELRQRIKEV